MTTLRAVVLGCSLKASPAPSSSELLGREVLAALADHDVDGEVIRIVDHRVRFGVSTDEGDGDEWPAIRAKILDAQILVIATPIWMGQPSSVCKMVLERLDAELAETDDQGRLLTYGKIAAVAVVGNEDGAHHVTAEVLQALNDVGFTLAAAASTYWVGEAMGKVDYNDAGQNPTPPAPRPQHSPPTPRTWPTCCSTSLTRPSKPGLRVPRSGQRASSPVVTSSSATSRSLRLVCWLARTSSRNA